MGFRSVDSLRAARFNSANSSNFLNLYESLLEESILEGESKIPSRTFAPSQIRCKRVSWFRLRGTLPEQETEVDRALNFTAQVGTACHRNIQDLLSRKFSEGDNEWLDVEAFLKSADRPYTYSCINNGYETFVNIQDPPIKFAPDGIIRYKGKVWLLEIKTSEYSSFDKLTEPKPQHIDQVKCYCTLLDIPQALVLYQDRVFGGLKCYEVNVSADDMAAMWEMFKDVEKHVSMNIAPEKPEDRHYCTPSYCRYYNVCKQW